MARLAARQVAARSRFKRADLIVIGALRDQSIADRLLGTVASDVVRRADCEVLIVRPRAGERA